MSPEPSSCDPLTGLLDRRSCLNEIRRLIGSTQGAAVAVLFLDLNEFKDVNDTYGHDCGDSLLKAVADRLRQVVRHDDVVGRLGGDEFLVATVERRPGAAISLAHRLDEHVSLSVNIGGLTLHPRVSVGVASTADGEATVEQLIEEADLAMYEAKAFSRTGRTPICAASDASREAVLRRHRLKVDFVDAWQAGQVTHHYQPIRRLTDGEILGAEALLRWHHTELGPISPGEIMMVANTPEHLMAFTEWTLASAASRWSDLRRRYPIFGDKGVSVNMDPGQVIQPRYMEVHSRVLAEHRLRLVDVVIEVQDWDKRQGATVNEAMSVLADAGVPIALDYFDVGYNALECLHRTAIAGFKISPKLTRLDPSVDEETTRRSEAIVRGLLETTTSLGVQTLAFGIEDGGHLDRCRQLGLSCGQGTHLGVPRPIDDFDGSAAVGSFQRPCVELDR